MSFLDNLENTLKNLESREVKDPDAIRREREQAMAQKAVALAAAPFAEALRNGPFTQELLNHSVAIGHSLRAKVQITWIGQTLRLDARERRLELRPTPEGVRASFMHEGNEVDSELIHLEPASAAPLAKRWLKQ